MNLKKGRVRLAAAGLMAVALVAPGIPLAPRTAAAAHVDGDDGPWRAWIQARSAEDCEFQLRFGRASWDSPTRQLLPAQLRLNCDAPLAGMQLTINGKPLPADIRVRGGDAMLTTAVPLAAGQAGGSLCLIATLMGNPVEEFSQCIALPEAPRLPERALEAAQPQTRPRPAAAPETPPASAAATRAAAPEKAAAAPDAKTAAAPASAGPGMRVLESSGRPLDAVEASSSSRPPVTRSGPDTSLKLPKGHSWALDDAPKITETGVDNAIARALRNVPVKAVNAAPEAASGGRPETGSLSGPAPSEAMPSVRPAASAAAPQRGQSLPGLQVLESSGGPADADASTSRTAPRRRLAESAPPANQSRATGIAPGPEGSTVQEGAAGRARPSHIIGPPVISGEGRIVESRLNRAVIEPRDGPDTAIRRAVRPAVPLVMPKALVKAGDPDLGSNVASLAVLGLIFTAAGIVLRRKARPQPTVECGIRRT